MPGMSASRTSGLPKALEQRHHRPLAAHIPTTRPPTFDRDKAGGEHRNADRPLRLQSYRSYPSFIMVDRTRTLLPLDRNFKAIYSLSRACFSPDSSNSQVGVSTDLLLRHDGNEQRLLLCLVYRYHSRGRYSQR